MLGGRKTVKCKFLGTGMISVMPVPVYKTYVFTITATNNARVISVSSNHKY